MSDLSLLQTSIVTDFIYKSLSLDSLRCPEELFDSRAFNANDPLPVHLPILVFNDGDTYTVLDGCKRLLQLRLQGKKEILCGILNTSADKLVLLNRILFNQGRKLHFREKILFVRWLKDNVSKSDYLSVIHLLGIENRERYELEGVLECSDEILEAIISGNLDCAVAAEVKKLSNPDTVFFLNLCKKLVLSKQYQRELIDWLIEIAFQKKSSIQEVLSDFDLQSLLDNDKINGPQKIRKLRDYIYSIRYPNLTEARVAWNRKINEINPDPSRINFQSSDYFEKDRLEIKITLTDPAHAVTIFNKFAQISPEDWEKLIRPGRCL
ncbi:MAG: hypothetical protein GX640_15210 [Fibrobacter sp.]|nr:hypothetical protein [Fibrobacter sp.]